MFLFLYDGNCRSKATSNQEENGGGRDGGKKWREGRNEGAVNWNKGARTEGRRMWMKKRGAKERKKDRTNKRKINRKKQCTERQTDNFIGRDKWT